MYWSASRNVALAFPRFCSFTLLLRSPARRFRSFSPSSPPLGKTRGEQIIWFNEQKILEGAGRSTKKLKASKIFLDDKDLSHIIWWKERLQQCKKPSAIHLVKRLIYSNLLGLDVNLKNGSLKEGNLNWEMLQFKSKFPREILLCRVGDFYEAIGIDACFLVEYAGLNPFGGLRSDSVPRAGCPVVNLRQTLDDLTRNGYSVCIVEEIQGPVQARSRKSRFISGHAHPGNPYVFGLVGIDHDLDFPEPMPVVGISRSAKGYCIVSVLETMKTYSLEDSLTEEALVTKLRTCRYHHLFVHASLRCNTTGTCHWGEFGEGGLLWGECTARHFEWFEGGDPITELLFKVRELFGLDDAVVFRNVTVKSENMPRSLHLGTATQIGAIPTEGIPCLLKVLLPSTCKGLPVLYVRNLLLNPPAYEIASTIQATCKSMSNVKCSIPDFTCVSSAKLVKLLELKETNHVEFCRIKNMLDDILQMYKNSDLNEILKLLMDPTWVATGLKIDFLTLVRDCEWASGRISEMISLDDESDRKLYSCSLIPSEFFEDIESWKARVKIVHIEEEFAEVEKAAEALSLAVTEDFLPIIVRIKATTAPLGGPKGEILYSREHDAVWFKGKRFTPSVWAGTNGEEQIKKLKPAIDCKGRKVGEEWFTSVKVEEALVRYHDASDKVKTKVLKLLRGLSADLQTKINVLVFASTLLVVAKALFAHVSEGRRRKWVFPTLFGHHNSKDNKSVDEISRMKLIGLFPYWLDAAEGSAVSNTVEMQSLILLTGPNGGGKSSMLRSICASALLGICGFMVPAESATIPHFDSIMLHMKSYDSPADGKSSFQVEMSEVRSLITGASSRSLVLIDEICRGTETAKGTCIAGSIVESLDKIGCLGIVSTHLHAIFDLPLDTNNTVYKAMGTEYVNGQTKPTWKLIDGICKESLAFETAKKEGVPNLIVQRAQELYFAAYAIEVPPRRIKDNTKQFHFGEIVNGPTEQVIHRVNSSIVEGVDKNIEHIVTIICQRKLIELYREKYISELVVVQCVPIGAREQPPPSTIGASCVYVMLRPDNRLYVGVTDDLQGRVRSHRSREGLHNASFLYFIVQGKSIACQLETLLINQLPNKGFQLTNVADGKHRNFGSTNLSFESLPVH